MLKFPCLVLDHDDTVVQTERAIGYPYFRDFIESIRPGESLSFEEYVRDCNNMVFTDMCVQRWRMTEEELMQEYTGWKAYSRKNIPPVCEGMENVISRFKEAGGILCVASLSTHEIITRDYMHHFGFMPDAVYDYDLPVACRKPNPFALEDIMQRFALKPEQILMVDDMKLGWDMAKKCAVPTAYAAWSKKEFPDLAGEMKEIFDFSFDSPKELEVFLFE